MSGNFHPSLFWQFSDVSFHPLHMLVLSLIDNWVLVISVHTVSFSWYVRKSVFCNIYPVCICTYLLPYFLWIHTCVIRAHFCSGNKKVLLFNPKVFISFYQMTMQFDCELVNFWVYLRYFCSLKSKSSLNEFWAPYVALENCYKHEFAGLV